MSIRSGRYKSAPPNVGCINGLRAHTHCTHLGWGYESEGGTTTMASTSTTKCTQAYGSQTLKGFRARVPGTAGKVKIRSSVFSAASPNRTINITHSILCCNWFFQFVMCILLCVFVGVYNVGTTNVGGMEILYNNHLE